MKRTKRLGLGKQGITVEQLLNPKSRKRKDPFRVSKKMQRENLLRMAGDMVKWGNVKKNVPFSIANFKFVWDGKKIKATK